MIHDDEASFRQDSTLSQTWARRGCQPEIPVTGQRKGVKVFGAVEVFTARFLYRFAEVLNAHTYLAYLEQLAKAYFPRPTVLIQDNASYHKDQEVWLWFGDNRNWLTVHNLPPYCPELNATERLWHHARLHGTHNRYFACYKKVPDTFF